MVRGTAIGVAMMLWCGVVGAARAEVTISISCSSLGVEVEMCRSGAQAWAAKTGNKVKLVSTPADANERLSLYQTLLAARSTDIDVFQIDVIWPGALANHFADLRPYISDEELNQHFETLVTNNTVQGKLVAVPWFVDAGLLYYRKDLLEKYGKRTPTTWEEMAETAKTIMAAERAAGSGDIQGFVWQGRAYEGLTCNALEWVYSHGGGTIVDASGKVTIDNAQAIRAIDMAKSWIGSISPAGTLNYAEEDARGVFQSGKSVFMRNWPYAWSLANSGDSPVKGKVGIAALPRAANPQGRHAATLGGQNLALSRYSTHPKEAADLIRYLTGEEEEKRRAIEGSFNPTRRSLHQDKDVLTANPFYREFSAILDSAVARPAALTGRRYNQVSSGFVQAVHDSLSGRGSVEENLANLSRSLERLSRGGRW